MRCTKHLPVILPLAIASVTAQAQGEEPYELDKVVVTASRTAETVDQTLAPVTVITRKEIEQSQATSVPELLSKTPGVAIGSNGGPGALTSIFLRGTNSNQTVVLVDGVKINSATGGGASWQYLDPDQIQRIEIVRGPQSSLYGADAIGGVIQIFTRKGEGKPKLRIKAGTGSRDTHTTNINYGGKVDNTRFNLNAGLYETGGYDNSNDNAPAHKGVNRDDDAYRNKSFSADIAHTFANNSELGFSATHNEGKSEYDAYTCMPGDTWCVNGQYPYNAYTFFRNDTFNAHYTLPVNDKWTTKLQGGYSKEYSRNLGKDASPIAPPALTSIGTRRKTLTWQNDIAWKNSQLLTLGLDYSNEEILGSNTYINSATGKEVNDRYNKAFFIQNQSQFANSDLKIGLRRDKNEDYGYETTGNIAWGFNLPHDMRLIASYGTAFRAPTFNDLYWPDSGNPDLKPEKSKNKELELRGKHSTGSWSVAIFQNDIDDLINWAPEDPSNPYSNWVPQNVDQARIRGLEAAYNTSLAGWNLNTNLTLLDPKDKKTDKMLTRRPRQRLVIDADRAIGKLSFGGTLRTQSETYDNAANDIRLGGFSTFDLRTRYKFTPEFTGELKVVNLLDKNYKTSYQYDAEPRGVFVSMIWTPEL